MPDLIMILANGQPTSIILDRAQFEETAGAGRLQHAVCMRCSFRAPQHAPGCSDVDKPRCPDCGHYWCSGCASLWTAQQPR